MSAPKFVRSAHSGAQTSWLKLVARTMILGAGAVCGRAVPARTGRVGAGLAEGGKFDVAGRRRATGPVVALAPGHRGSGSRAGGVHDQPGVVAVREEEPVGRLL